MPLREALAQLAVTREISANVAALRRAKENQPCLLPCHGPWLICRTQLPGSPL